MGVFGGLILRVKEIVGLVSEYLFSNNYNDTSGNGFNAINNGTTFTTDRKSQANSAIQLVAASTQFVNIDSPVTELQNTTIGSWSVWIKANDGTPASAGRIITFAESTLNEYIILDLDTTGQIRLFTADSAVLQFVLVTDNQVILDTTWTHIAVTQDGIEPEIYIDAVKVAQTFTSTTNKTTWFNQLSIDNGRIGCINFISLGDTGFFDGDIDDIRIYNTVLSQAEITALYNE